MPNKELIAASTRPMLLALLRAGESYGYEIIDRVPRTEAGKLNRGDLGEERRGV